MPNNAVAQGIVNNQTLGYFIARDYLFLVKCGIKPEGIRFRHRLDQRVPRLAVRALPLPLQHLPAALGAGIDRFRLGHFPLDA